MPPIVVTLVIMVSFLAAGTLIGGALLMVGARIIKTPNFTPQRAGSIAFMASAVGGAFFGLLLRFLDKPEQDLINTAFFAAVGAAAAVSYLVVMKSLDVEPNKIPMAWLPLAVGILIICYGTRVFGTQLRESQGYYRGFEKLAHYNLPRSELSTPEGAVNFYIQQFKKLREMREDEGPGEMMPTATHFDQRWFLDNYEFIFKKDQESDPLRLGSIVTSPNAHKIMAMQGIARPLFGKIEDAKTDGNDAVVRMSSGQLVRLTKEGRNWKICDWARMRGYMMREIYEVKSKDGSLTPEDERWHGGYDKEREGELKSLCAKLNINYQPFDPSFDEDSASGTPGMALLGGSKPKKKSESATGYSKLDQAKPGEFVGELPDKPDAGASKAGAPPPQPPQIAQLPPSQGPPGSGPPAIGGDQTAGLPPAEPVPGLPPGASPAAPPGAPPAASPVAPPGASPVAPAAVQAQPTPIDPNAPTPTPTPLPFIVDNLPVETFWPRYFSALRGVQQGGFHGPEEFENIISEDDRQWLHNNCKQMADILTPGVPYGSFKEAKVAVLRAMMRNMPTDPAARITSVKSRGAIAVCKIAEDGPNGKVEYTAMLLQDNGRWTLTHFFFTRDFIWTPQLADYKRMKNLPLSPEEQAFLTAGFTPFQQQVRQFMASVGIGG